ncbi:MAG TPA: hypothetical protein PLC59_00545 [Bacteroidales bacterium]|nr:hypothetical protein [Bacteroidales bacterium]
MIKLKNVILERRIKIYRGVSYSNEGGEFYATSIEQARGYSLTGKEIETAEIDSSRIYRAPKLPFGGDEREIESAIEQANENGYSAFWVYEGQFEAPSIYVINPDILFNRKSIKLPPQRRKKHKEI